MSNNCLVTKLKGVVDNAQLPVLGAIEIEVVAKEGQGDFTNWFEVTIVQTAPVMPVIRGVGGTFKINGGDVEYAEYTSPTSSVIIGVKNANYKIQVLNAKYYVWGLNFNPGSASSYNTGNGSVFKLNVEQLNYSSYFGAIYTKVDSYKYGKLSTNPANISGIALSTSGATEIKPEVDLDHYAGSTRMQEVMLVHTNSHGSIESLAQNTSLRYIFSYGSNITGNVDNFAQLMVAAGRTTGTCIIGINPGKITCSVPITGDKWTITFDSSIPEGYSIS